MPGSRVVLLFAALVAPLTASAEVKKVRVAVLEIRPVGTEPAKAETLSEIALTEAAAMPGFDVIGKSDINSMIGFEKQKQVMGCADDSTCLAEVGGALGVDFIVVGSLGKIGSLYRIDLKLVETKKARVRGRIGVTVDRQEEKLVAAVQKAVRDLLEPATPRDEPVARAEPSRRPEPEKQPAKVESKPQKAEKSESKPSLAAAPPRPSFPIGAPPPAGKSRALGWTAFGAGIATVGLGAFAGYEAFASSKSYGKANELLGAGGTLLPGANPAVYSSYVSDGDSAKSMAFVGGGAAVGCAVLGGVLGYVSYRQTGEIGPFRF